MACNCGKKGEIKRGNQLVCKHCFTDQIEKRIKKALKVRELQKGERVLVVGELAAYLVKRFIHVPIKLECGKEEKDGYGVTIIEWTMDDECVEFLKGFEGDLKFVENPNVIKALRLVSDEDAALYAKIKGVNFEPRKKDSDWQEFLQKFNPEMKHNLLRNVGEIKNLLK